MMDDAQVRQMAEMQRQGLHVQRESLTSMISDMKLRQWCVERAIQVIESERENKLRIDVLSALIMKFVSEPFADIFKE